MSDTALTSFSDKPNVTVELRAAELSFLIYLLERGGMSARHHETGNAAAYAQVCDKLLTKLTDLEGTTEDRFDRAVAEIVKRG